MRIGIDIDGVLADFNKAFVARVRLATGKDLFPKEWLPHVTPEPPTWYYDKHYGYTKEESDVVWDSIRGDKLFWRDLDPLPGMKELCEVWPGIDAKHDVYFITARPGVQTKKQTEAWLRNQGIQGATVIISEQKGTVCQGLEIDTYIDDRPENYHAVEWYARRTRPYLFRASYNTNEQRLCECVGSVREWIEKEGLI